MPEFVFKTLFNKEKCVGSEKKDCPSCVGGDFLGFPCTTMSNETIVILNPEKLREGCEPPDLTLCERKDYETCLECLRSYFKSNKPCVKINRREKRKYKRWIQCGGELGFEEIKELAEFHNLELLEFYKPAMFFWNHMLCKGTPENIQRFDKKLRKKGHEVKNRCPSGGLDI